MAHPYLPGPNGDSNGCVSVKDYAACLRAYENGEIKRLMVVASANPIVASNEPLRERRREPIAAGPRRGLPLVAPAYFTAPIVRPSTRYRCVMKAKTITGKDTMNAPALMASHSTP